MEETVLLGSKEDVKALYDEVRGEIYKSPMNRCIIEHASEMISGDDLEKRVLECRAEEFSGRNKREYGRALNRLIKQATVSTYIVAHSDELHYKISPFAMTTVQHLKKIYPKKANHL